MSTTTTNVKKHKKNKHKNMKGISLIISEWMQNKFPFCFSFWLLFLSFFLSFFLSGLWSSLISLSLSFSSKGRKKGEPCISFYCTFISLSLFLSCCMWVWCEKKKKCLWLTILFFFVFFFYRSNSSFLQAKIT